MSNFDLDEAAKQFARFLAGRQTNRGISSGPKVSINETTFEPNPIEFLPSYGGAGAGGGGVPPEETFYIVMEDGTSYILTETFNGILLEP